MCPSVTKTVLQCEENMLPVGTEIDNKMTSRARNGVLAKPVWRESGAITLGGGVLTRRRCAAT